MLKRQLSLFSVCLLVAFGFLAAITSASMAAGQSDPRALQGTPQTVLAFWQDISEWRMTSGFIYLTDTCTDFSAQTTAYIRRRAVYGQFLNLLESVNGTPQCRTFRHAAADESGIYYYNRHLGRLEAIYSDTPDAPPTPLATIGDWNRIGFGDGISALRLDSSYVYWIEQVTNGEFNPDDIAIKRVSKSGGTPTTLLSYSGSQVSFDGLGITSGRVWWTDGDGLNRISSCTPRPCFPGTNPKITEFSLSAGEGHIQVSGANIFWWSGDETPERIRRTSCSFFSNECSTSTFHTTNNGITIIGLAANSELAFWTEDVSQIGRRLRRKALSGGTAETLLDDVDYAAPYLDVDGVYFQTDDRTISRLPFHAAALTREISITGWEVTQGIQRLANDVPLVAGKTTYVRLYPTLDEGADVGAATAELHGSRNGQSLPDSPIYPLNLAIPIPSSLSLADRGILDSGWLFRLPESWTRTGDGLIPQEDTTITLRAVIDPNGVYAGTDNPGNNEITGDFRFTAKAPTCMTMRPVATHGPYQPVYGINVGQVVELTEAVLPTPRLITFPDNDPLRETDWCWKGIVYGPFCSTPYELNDDDSDLLTKMGWLNAWTRHAVCYENNARSLYAGIVHKDDPWDVAGTARLGENQFLAEVPEYGDTINRFNERAMTMVHEIGHNFNRKHVQCPLPPSDPDDEDDSPSNPDPNYPYPTDMLDFDLPLDDTSLHFGFDPLRQSPIIPTITPDFMSYCAPEWYSDYTWKAIFNNTGNTIFTSPSARAEGDLVRIAGLIDAENNRGTLDYAWTLPGEATSDSLRQKWSAALTSAWDNRSVQASYHLQLIGTEGQVLADQVVELASVEDGQEHGPQPFELALVAPAAAVARLQLMADDAVLATLTPGTGQPMVTIDQPTSGANVGHEITVGWTAVDPDNDQLLYTIQYSPNGGDEWVPLLVNDGGTGTASETITLDLSAQPGSEGANALVRVLASDGYNTAVATSPPFTVARRAPFAAITSPAVGQTFAAGETIPLNSFASDPEDGLIANAQFAWSTGQTGQTAELSGLAPGSHTLQLTVTDSDGLNATDEVSSTVAPLAVPETANSFVLDGRCDDAGYQDAPQLPLAAYANGTHATARIIHNSSRLWLCLTGLQDAGGYAGLLVDAGNSGEATVQSGDFGYFVRQDGTRFVNEGNGSNFESAPAGTLSARIFDHGPVWTAELQIAKIAFGSWQKRVALAIGHFEQTGNEASAWPHSAGMTSPQSWGQTNLGLVATLTAVTPETAVLGTDGITLTVKGTGFDTDNVVLWNGTVVSTTLVDASTLTATVPATSMTSAGTYGVSVGVEEVDGLTTTAHPFIVNNPQPTIISLNPDTAEIGSDDTTVTINGTDFVDGAAVVWNGETRTTTFVSPTQLRISVTAAELTRAYAVPLVGVNPEPSVGPSNTATFVISSGLEHLFLPLARR